MSVIILVESNFFWSCPNHFGQVQIRFFWTNFFNLDLSITIWTWWKWIGPVQNDWYSTKMILRVQNNFGPFKLLWDQFVLVRFKSFWTGPNYKNSPEKSDLNLTKIIWTQPKRFGPDQNNLYQSKTIWTYKRTRHQYPAYPLPPSLRLKMYPSSRMT